MGQSMIEITSPCGPPFLSVDPISIKTETLPKLALGQCILGFP
jgi:hypothetical protein